MGLEASDARMPARLGRYTLVRALGAGGMAELFLARADGIGGFAKLVAVKRILPHKANNERFVRMLIHEARLVATLDHPNIAAVHDIGVDAGAYFFSMEYVHGHDLRRVLQEAPTRQLQVENALHVAIGVCAGLHHAHEARDPSSGRSLELVHRDVSPSNVLISYEGAVKLVDFGVAKAATLVSETGDGMVKGKYGYMSPEQCIGEPLDRRSDLFAVGILLWEMTVGRRLYKLQGDLASMQRVVYVDAPRPSRFIPDYPPLLERIVMRALARDPGLRYGTAQQMQLELEAFAVEYKLPVSAVSMGLEMRRLFRDRIDAWHEAEQAGRSLADHLAELGSEDSIASQDDAAAACELRDETAPVTLLRRPTAQGLVAPVDPSPAAGSIATGDLPSPRGGGLRRPPSAEISSAPTTAPRRPRARILGVVVAVLVIGGGGAWLATTTRGSSTPSDLDAIEAPAADRAITLHGPEPIARGTVASGSDAPGATHDEAPGAPDEPAPEATEPVAGIDTPRVRERTSEPKVRPSTRKPKRPTKIARAVPRAKQEPRVDAPEAPAVTPTPPADAAPPAVVAPPAGTVDPSGVRAVVRAHMAEIQACVSRARMEDRDLKGTVTLRIALANTGAVTSATVASSKGATGSLEACLIGAVERWQFPAPAGAVAATIRYPFTF